VEIDGKVVSNSDPQEVYREGTRTQPKVDEREIGERPIERIIQRPRLRVVSDMHQRALTEIPIGARKSIDDAVRIGQQESVGEDEITEKDKDARNQKKKASCWAARSGSFSIGNPSPRPRLGRRISQLL
jgi:hypothetical protein